MARTDTSMKPVEGVDPNYLERYAKEDKSLEGMEEHRILPRHKVIQAVSKQELIDQYGVGSIIINPGNAILWQRNDEPFKVTPVLFFTEYCKWADLKDSEKVVAERTFDGKSDIALKAADPERRFEVYPGHEDKPAAEQMLYRYVRHFRFVCVVNDIEHPLHTTPFTLSFERGEDFTGRSFLSAIKLRKVTVGEGEEVRQIQVPLYAQIWELKASLRERNANKWWGVDFMTPENNLVPERDIEEMKSLHEDMLKMKEAERLIVDEATEEEIEAPASEPF